MRTVRIIQNESDYAKIVKGGFPAPSVIHVESSDKTYIRGKYANKNNAIPGDVVCFNGNNDIKIVRQGALADNGIPYGYTAQAIVVVPSAHRTDGKLTCCSIGHLSNTFGERGVFDWAPSDCQSAFVYSGAAAYADNIGTSSVVFGVNALNGENLLLPSDGFGGSLSADDLYARYGDSEIDTPIYCPSPYFEDDTLNDVYRLPMFNNGAYSNVFGVDGTETGGEYFTDPLALTNAISNSAGLGGTSAVSMASGHHTDNLQSGWYLPSMRELAYLCNRFKSVSTSAEALGASKTIVSEMPIISINGFVDNATPYIWAIDMSNGSIKNVSASNDANFFVFAFIRI